MSTSRGTWPRPSRSNSRIRLSRRAAPCLPRKHGRRAARRRGRSAHSIARVSVWASEQTLDLPRVAVGTVITKPARDSNDSVSFPAQPHPPSSHVRWQPLGHTRVTNRRRGRGVASFRPGGAFRPDVVRGRLLSGLSLGVCGGRPALLAAARRFGRRRAPGCGVASARPAPPLGRRGRASPAPAAARARSGRATRRRRTGPRLASTSSARAGRPARSSGRSGMRSRSE